MGFLETTKLRGGHADFLGKFGLLEVFGEAPEAEILADGGGGVVGGRRAHAKNVP